MNPVPNIVFISPGKEEMHNGPDTDWVENLGTNLALVLQKAIGSAVKSITPDSKEAAGIISKADVLITLMHESYPASGKYLDLLNKCTGEGKDKCPPLIRLDASPENRTNTPGGLRQAASVEMHQQSDGKSVWFGEESGAYWSKLLDLAAEVKALAGNGTPAAATQRTVYLAESSRDMSKNRDILKRELLEYGYQVTAVTDLDLPSAELKSKIQSLVDRSHLAIHLLGNAYGEVLKDTGLSIAEMQVQFVGEYLEAIENDPVHAEKELGRLIWIDPEYNPVDSSQEEFVSRLKKNIENLHRTEIIQTPLELFKTLVIKKLQKSDERIPKATGKDAQPGFLYLIHAPDDQKDVRELSESLQKEGVPTRMLNYEERNLLNDHKNSLRDCDGALIYYGHANRPWLRSKVLDLLKAPGMGRIHAFRCRQVLAGKKDLLEDYIPPVGISVIRETDIAKAIAQIVKNLNR